jgi:signal transduction histidine kinase
MIGWEVVLSRDSTVLAAAAGAPAAWTGTRLVTRGDIGEDVREAARTMMHRATHVRSMTVWLSSLDRFVHFRIVDAIPLRRTDTNVGDLLRANLEVMQRQAKTAGVVLTLDIHPAAPRTVRLDADKLAWAVTLLVGNALRYVQHATRLAPGGTITVRIAYDERTPAIVVDVEDDGPGVPPETVRSLFRDSADGARAPLGLLMIREVVAGQGGTLDVQSDTDPFQHGTRIRLTLPAA